MRNILAAFILFICVFPLTANSQWAKSYGEDNGTYSVFAARKAQDDGYILTGTYNLGSKYRDGWVLKLSLQGEVEWMRSYCPLFDICLTTDGGYIASGDRFILKLDVLGEIDWYLPTDDESFYTIQQTEDEGFIVSGTTYPDGSTASFILKLSSHGVVAWKKMFAIGDRQGSIITVKELPGGGYVAVGNTSFNQGGPLRFWLIKLDAFGEPEWQKKFGGDIRYSAQDLKVSDDGSFLVVGNTNPYISGERDIFVAKFQSDGTVVWQHLFAGIDSDAARNVEILDDGGCVILGYTSANKSSLCLMLKLTPSGTIEWQRTFGGGEDESDRSYAQAYAICQVGDEDYTVTGHGRDLRDESESSSYYPPQDILVFNFSLTGDSQNCSYLKIPNLTQSDLFLDSQELTFNLRDYKIQYGDWSEYVPWADAATIDIYNLCPQIFTKIIKKGAVKR